MADIVVSYASADHQRVARLVAALEGAGWIVWWDQHLKPGTAYEEAIDHQIAQARCVLVMLSKAALESEWVRAEASEARERGLLIPVLLEDVRMPLAFRHVQAAKLLNWPNDTTGFEGLAARIRELAGTPDVSALGFGLVGREDELTRLEEAFERARTGAGHLLLVAGEPGIGKTSLIQSFATFAEGTGAAVLSGQCFEERGAPPYALWSMVLRQGLEEAIASPEALEPEAELLDIAMPNLGITAGSATGGRARREALLDSGEWVADVRYRMFDAISNYLGAICEERPTLLLLEDLHWASRASLRLLEFLSRRFEQRRILVLATYRDAEVRRSHPLFETLATLNRQANVERVRLGGLSNSGSRALLEKAVGRPVQPRLAQAVHQQANGNPLFIQELGRVLAPQLAGIADGPVEIHIPEGIKETIGHRLNRLSSACNDVLTVAAVLGVQFSQRELNTLLPDVDTMELLGFLDEAERAGIIDPISGELGHYQFSHALVRETLYDELPLTRRVLLHRNVASMLEELYGDRLDSIVGRLARHYYRAAQAGDVESAVTFSIRAGKQAEASMAYEEALDCYRMALDAIEMDHADHLTLKAEAYSSMAAISDHAGIDFRRGSEFAKQAIAIARAIRADGVFARAASHLIKSRLFEQDAHDVVDEALLLPGISKEMRAQLLCDKALALKHAGKRTEAERFVRQAIDIARGSKRAAHPLAWSQLALAGRPEKLSERLRLGEEGFAIATADDDLPARAETSRWLVMGYAEAGRFDRAREVIEQMREDAKALRSINYTANARVADGMLCMASGRWSDAAESIERGFEIGGAVYRNDASGVYGTQMHWLQRETGQLQRLAPLLRPEIEKHLKRCESTILWRLPGMCLEVGMVEDARHVLAVILNDELALLPKDDLYAANLASVADCCARLGITSSASTLYAALLPYSGQMILEEFAVCLGPADLYLGRLAALLNRTEEAEAHLSAALGFARDAGSSPWQAHAEFHLGVFMATRPDREAISRKLLTAGAQRARAMQMIPLEEACTSRLESPPEIQADDLTPRELELLKLIAAGRSNKDIAKALGISLNTVATHVRSILNKTYSANRTEAAAYAMRHGLT